DLARGRAHQRLDTLPADHHRRADEDGDRRPGSMLMSGRQRSSVARGFSLIEVLVALVVVSVALLGIAKMQAIAYSSTGVASKRSLAAIEAASLASSMHANRAYWSVPGTAALNTTVNGIAIASSDPGLAAGGNCTVGGTIPCTPNQLAAYDMQSW